MAKGSIHKELLYEILSVIKREGIYKEYDTNYITRRVRDGGYWQFRDAETPERTVNHYFNINTHIFLRVSRGTFKVKESFIDSEAEYFGNCTKISRTLNVSDIDALNNSDATSIEGAKSDRLTIVYERDPKLRKQAIDIHGLKCQVCGFDFEEDYGSLGAGFIEVHHITPLATVRSSHVVDPYSDLATVCSNCHRMIHRSKEQPLSICELKKLIRD